MNYHEAIESAVTIGQLISECEAHGIRHVDYDDASGGRLEAFCTATGETIAYSNSDHLFSGADVLVWLGY